MTTQELSVAADRRRSLTRAGHVEGRACGAARGHHRRGVTNARGRLAGRALAIADGLAFLAAFSVATAIVPVGGTADPGDASIEVALFGATLPLWLLVARMYGLYDRDERRTDHSTVDEFQDCFHLVTVGCLLLLVLASATGLWELRLPRLIVFWAVATGFLVTGRAMARAVFRRKLAYLQNAVVVGAGDVGQLVAMKLRRHPEYGIRVVGFVDASPKERSPELQDIPMLGVLSDLPALVHALDVDRVIVAFSRDSYVETLKLVSSMKHLDVRVDIVPRFFEAIGATVSMHSVEGIPLMELPPLRLAGSSLALKRALDISLSALGLFVLVLPLAFIGLLIRIDSSGPALYRDERVGRDGRRFNLFKFRSLRATPSRGCEPDGSPAARSLEELLAESPALRAEFELTHKLRDDPRVTRVGRILRRTSLDELPQLLNVLRGDISLVGPRPITAYEYSLLGPRRGGDHVGYWAIGGLRPGVTGYWQINGRSAVSYAERRRLDMAYVSSWSLGLDLTILAKTARALLTRSGAD